MTSGNVEHIFLGILVAAALPMFEVISKAMPGFLRTLVDNFIPAIAELHPKILKKPPSPSACIVLSLTVIDFFLLLIEQYLNNFLLNLDVISP